MRTLTTALIVAAGLAAAAPAFAANDGKSFMKTAIEGNYSEIDVGKLAQDKSSNPQVKQFGAMLVKDHTEANSKAMPVVKQLDVDPPKSSGLMEKGTYLKLKVLSGETFDRSFINGAVDDHQKDVKLYQDQANGSGPAAEFAKQILPKLQQHLAEAQKIQAGLKQAASTTGRGDARSNGGAGGAGTSNDKR